MKPSLVVRFATEADVPALAALEAAAFPDPWLDDSIAREVEGPGTLVLVAAEGWAAPPVAYAAYRAVAGEAELLRLAVVPEARRRGHAQALLAAGRDHLAGFGCTRCFLEVRADNAAAIALYERVGFHPVGRRPGYYGRGADAVLYAGSLGRSTGASPTRRGRQPPGRPG